MTSEPPASGRPSGPPSGPLSGRPSEPPSGPPSHPTGGGGGAGAPEPHRPWWSSVPRMALLVTAVVAVVVLAVVLTTTGDGSSARGEVFLQSAGEKGPDPFTGSTAKEDSAPPPSPVPTGPSQPANAVRSVQGGAPGLYGGTRNVSSCDVEQQIRALTADPAKNRAFASVARVRPGDVPGWLRSLTPLQLRMDTRVTNHGYRDGAATAYQAVLQAGTAVLVDDQGVPRVRCACGNPLTPPVAQKTAPRYVGGKWPSYRPQNVVVVTPSPKTVKNFVVFDLRHHDWFARTPGDTGRHDRPAPPPASPWPPATATVLPPPSGSRPPCPPGASGQSPGCPATSTAPSSPSSPPTKPSSPASPSPETSPPSPESSSTPPQSPGNPSPPTSPGSPPEQSSPSSPPPASGPSSPPPASGPPSGAQP
ncbi:DUF6777 domain-containing protein [Streptomyces sp. NPDC005526]|uniref:DUF6777 domain-containing protein n=1 Tax=Streptomyces sp. NPDC005526 TaxID=3156885 RepID=UPI00339DE3C4